MEDDVRKAFSVELEPGARNTRDGKYVSSVNSSEPSEAALDSFHTFLRRQHSDLLAQPALVRRIHRPPGLVLFNVTCTQLGAKFSDLEVHLIDHSLGGWNPSDIAAKFPDLHFDVGRVYGIRSYEDSKTLPLKDAPNKNDVRYTDPAFWVREDLDLYYERFQARLWFWKTGFWDVVMRKFFSHAINQVNAESSDEQRFYPHLEYRLTEEKQTTLSLADIDFEYFSTGVVAPVLRNYVGTIYERYMENSRIMEEVGAKEYLYGLLSERQVKVDTDFSYIVGGVIDLVGNDVCWPKELSDFIEDYVQKETEKELKDETYTSPNSWQEDYDFSKEASAEDWGTLYVIPFPFSCVFLRDGSQDYEVFCASPLVYGKRVVVRVQLEKLKGLIRLNQQIEETEEGNQDELKETRVHAVAQYRNLLRSLDGARFSALERVNILNDLTLHLENGEEKKDANAQENSEDSEETESPEEISAEELEKERIRKFYVYPVPTTLDDWYPVRFIPGLYCGLTRQILWSKSTRNESWNSFRIKRNAKKAAKVWKMEVAARANKIEKAKTDIRNEFLRKANHLPYDFHVQVVLNPDLTQKELMAILKSQIAIGGLLSEYEPFKGPLEEAITRQNDLKRFEPRRFVWFMYWYSFFERNKLRRDIRALDKIFSPKERGGILYKSEISSQYELEGWLLQKGVSKQLGSNFVKALRDYGADISLLFKADAIRNGQRVADYDDLEMREEHANYLWDREKKDYCGKKEIAEYHIIDAIELAKKEIGMDLDDSDLSGKQFLESLKRGNDLEEKKRRAREGDGGDGHGGNKFNRRGVNGELLSGEHEDFLEYEEDMLRQALSGDKGEEDEWREEAEYCFFDSVEEIPFKKIAKEYFVRSE